MTDLRHQGVVLLNTRINFYDGRRPADNEFTGSDPDYDYWRGRHSKWTVVRHEPKAPTWARSTHTRGWKAHLVKYQLIATHVGGMQVQITVWKCGGRCMSPIEVDHHPYDRASLMCWTCRGRKTH